MPGPPSLQPKTEIGPLFLLFKAHFSLNLPKQIVHPLLANEISPNPKTKITKPDFSSRQMLQLFNYREQRLQPYLLHNLYNSPPASAAVVGWLRLTGTVLVAWYSSASLLLIIPQLWTFFFILFFIAYAYKCLIVFQFLLLHCLPESFALFIIFWVVFPFFSIFDVCSWLCGTLAICFQF